MILGENPKYHTMANLIYKDNLASANPAPDQPALSVEIEHDVALPSEPNLDQIHTKSDESDPIEAQPSTVQSDKWQAVKQDKRPVVPIATYVQGKKPSNNVYF